MSFELQRTKRRIATTRQIRKVTGAMQQVASARLVGDRRTLRHSNLYTERLAELIREVAAEAPHQNDPLLAPRSPVNISGLIVFGAARGLCGGYSAVLMEHLRRFINDRPRQTVELIVVGQVAQRRARRAGYGVVEAVEQPRRQARAATVDFLTRYAIDRFMQKRYQEVNLLYTQFISPLKQEVISERLLPAPVKLESRGPGEFIEFEPPAAVVLKRLLPQFVRQTIDSAFLHGLTSEDAARQQAMTRASENAGEMLKEFTAKYRRLRQQSITTEMLELVGGGVQLQG